MWDHEFESTFLQRGVCGAVNRHHGIGWEALHVCIDDTTRLAYSEILANERKDSAIGFLERALGCGAVIGFERQWRQRMAGLRPSSIPTTSRTAPGGFSAAC
jgi:hypothetical protein